MENINKIISDYTAGEMTLEEANAALTELGAGVLLDPEKNVIRPGEEDRFGLLDTGTGTLDKAEVRDGRLVCGVGSMRALCFFNGKAYEVHDAELEEI